MKTEKTSGQLRELFRVAYVENQDQAVKTHELDRFLNPCITMRTVKKGEDIVRPTDKLQSIIMVVKGGAHFIRVSTDGNTNMLAAVNAPFFIGITQLVSNDKEYYSQIIAAKNCLLLYIDCNYFLKEIREDGEAALVVIRDLAKVVERNHTRMDRMVFLKASNNLMAYIESKWNEGETSRKDRQLIIRERHGVIAADLSVSVRTLYRSINSLKDEGLLSVQKGGVLIVNEAQTCKIGKNVINIYNLYKRRRRKDYETLQKDRFNITGGRHGTVTSDRMSERPADRRNCGSRKDGNKRKSGSGLRGRRTG